MTTVTSRNVSTEPGFTLLYIKKQVPEATRPAKPSERLFLLLTIPSKERMFETTFGYSYSFVWEVGKLVESQEQPSLNQWLLCNGFYLMWISYLVSHHWWSFRSYLNKPQVQNKRPLKKPTFYYQQVLMTLEPSTPLMLFLGAVEWIFRRGLTNVSGTWGVSASVVLSAEKKNPAK